MGTASSEPVVNDPDAHYAVTITQFHGAGVGARTAIDHGHLDTM